ncbi:adenylate/guanylate cyclase domain-containing protein [Phenylobacterium sp.]|jgi:adenylate cyclase|uniref:adenylate/guanylate cyclase domain-containing protein n=1 Tax=Phenylobacterium sp. TaxID=1871053 RepID=UPI002E2FE80B|nr:adenylate/guanylate cyclase domain-containing protein [Phenylobacterium sp.]HEX3367058.1 adenylate/guanylate cyclase domain-containing protein [Phenylobacterium sp.]
MNVSVAAKIFLIAATVVVAMTIVSVVNLISSRNVSLGIQRITSGYLNIYGDAATINVYTTEEAYRTRQYILEKTLGLHHPGNDLPSTVARLQVLDDLVHKNLVEARRITARELSNPDPLVDKAQLARIDERLTWIENEEKSHLDRQVKLITALDHGDMAQFNEGFSDLTKWRANYDSYMDTTRSMVFAAASDAGRQVTVHQARAMDVSVALLTLACVLAIGTALVLARQLVRPLRDLLVGIRAISSGQLEVQVPVKTKDEVGRLTEAFNQMTEELRVGIRARELFGKYIDNRIARQLIAAPQALGQEGERRTMTVMFCDLQGFTRMSEQMTPRGLVAIMNRHFTLMSEAVRDNRGVIDKFIGDAMMAYWGPPFVTDAEQGTLAALSAMAQIARVPQLQAELPDLVNMKQGLPSVNLRIGIATGEVLVGSIGSDVMRNFTVMGDAVNLASRLEGANKLYGTQILLAEETVGRLGDDIEVREIDSLIVVGQTAPVRVFELLGRRDQVPAAILAAREAYARGLDAYRRQDWKAARAAFDDTIRHMPDDKPSRLFLSRIEDMQGHPLAADWNGVWAMETK